MEAEAQHLEKEAVKKVLVNIAKGGVVVLVTLLGVFTFSMVGSLAYPIGGEGAIGGAVIGFIVCGVVSLCATGAVWWLVPDAATHFNVLSLLPSTLAGAMGEHGDFTVVVTVHESQNLKVKGLLPWNTADTYVEIACGLNPIKATCVRKDGKFNEQFRFRVNVNDKYMILKVKDQDIFGSTDIGYVSIDIKKHILSEGFPWRSLFKIKPYENDKIVFPQNEKYKSEILWPSLILSFDHTDDFSLHSPVRHAGYEFQRAAQRHSVEQAWVDAIGAKLIAEDKLRINDNKVDSYGTFSFLSQLEFKTDHKVTKHVVDAMHSRV